MPDLDFTPLQTFLRYYSAELDGKSGSPSAEASNALKESALRNMPEDVLAKLISSARHALSDFDESDIRKMFEDGHFYFVWRTSDAARRCLQDILTLAQNISNNGKRG